MTQQPGVTEIPVAQNQQAPVMQQPGIFIPQWQGNGQQPGVFMPQWQGNGQPNQG